MRIVRSFPHATREYQNVMIPLSDGTRLAARMWLPEGADEVPVPAILEFIPYRKRDLTADRDALTHPYFAGHGYACLRIDIRGSGESDGVLSDEYSQQELDDGVEVLRWIADQPWCTGAVGMIGISWGGFNSLQIAAMAPPQLKAIITLCSTDDRYADDVHYMGGCLLSDNLSWASYMFAHNSWPPDPWLVGDRWREMWHSRLENGGLWLETWLRHQRRDAYWRHGSVCEDYSRIQCPVFAISGWADGYSNAVFRLISKLQSPRRGLIGPWGHKYPHLGRPGPAIGFLQEALRWWDHWLKGEETGIMAEPLLRVYMQDSVPPSGDYRSRPGRWVGETEWPSPRIQWTRHCLQFGRLLQPGEHADEESLTVQSPLSAGLFAGKWCSFSVTPNLPHDQREDDGGSLIFESAPLEETVEILGPPVCHLEIAVDKPVAMLAARLSDMAPDDKATRVTYGLLNLTHREGRESPSRLVPGKRYRITLQMNGVAQVFPKGHRIRLSLSTSYWPLAWPPPEPVRLTVFTGPSSLELPTRPSRPEDSSLRPYLEPEGAKPIQKTVLAPPHSRWIVHRDLENDLATLEVLKDEGAYRIKAIELEVRRKTEELYTYSQDDFCSVRGEVRTERAFRRGDWSVETRTKTVLTSSKTDFLIEAELDAYEDGKRVFCKSWDRQVPRDHL